MRACRAKEGAGNTHEMRVEEREQVSVGRREQRQARLVHAYCSHGAVVAPSVDEGKSEPGSVPLPGGG
jgi:hypothetical protein